MQKLSVAMFLIVTTVTVPGEAVPTRQQVLSGMRQGTQPNQQQKIQAVEDALTAADQGDDSKLLQLHYSYGYGCSRDPGLADSGRSMSVDVDRKWMRDLCDFLDAAVLPKNAIAGIDASSLLTQLGTEQPFHEQSVEAMYQQSSYWQAGNTEGFYAVFCDKQRTDLETLVRGCDGTSCAFTSILAAQMEMECTNVPAMVSESARRHQQPVRPMPQMKGFAKYISSIGRTRAAATSAAGRACLSQAGSTIRCSFPTETATAFDAYRAKLEDTKKRFGSFFAKNFAELGKRLDGELTLLNTRAAETEKQCAIPPAGVQVVPSAFYAQNGCIAANLPLTKLQQIQVAYEAAWSKHLEAVAEHDQRQATAIALQRARDEKETRDRAEAFQRQSKAKLASRECRVAEAWAQYCNTSDRLTNAEAAIAHQHRIDVASGTVDVRMKRQLAEAKLVLGDQLTANGKSLATLRLKASRGQCKAASARSQVVQDACVLAATAPAPATCVEATDHLLSLFAAKGSDPKSDKILTDVLRARCQSDGWSAQARSCVFGAASADGIDACWRLLTQAQRDSAKADIQRISGRASTSPSAPTSP